jgi:hypothetical protein
MNSLSIFLAQLAGPTLLALGLGIFFSKDYYTRVYRDLEKEPLAVMMAGLTTLIAGIVLVLNHNIWENLATGIISAIGWLSILKGLVLIIYPKTASKMGDMVAQGKFFNIIAVLTIIIGGYLSYMAYFA